MDILDSFFNWEQTPEVPDSVMNPEKDAHHGMQTLEEYEKALDLHISQELDDVMDLDQDWYMLSELGLQDPEQIHDKFNNIDNFHESPSTSRLTLSTTTPYTPDKQEPHPHITPQDILNHKRSKSLEQDRVNHFAVNEFRSARSLLEPKQTELSSSDSLVQNGTIQEAGVPEVHQTATPMVPKKTGPEVSQAVAPAVSTVAADISQLVLPEGFMTTRELLIIGDHDQPTQTQTTVTNTDNVFTPSVDFGEPMNIDDFLLDFLNAYGSSSHTADMFNVPSYMPTTTNTSSVNNEQYFDGNSRRESDSRRRGSFSNQRRVSRSKARKPIPERFKILNDNVTLVESHIQCLNVLIDYGQYRGTIINEPKVDISLCNQFEPNYLLLEYQDCVKPAKTDIQECSPFTAVGQRIRIERRIDEIWNSVSNIVYLESDTFSTKAPYEPQYVRFELDEQGKLVNETKCGLCPYCHNVKFLLFKNSSYLSHLTLEHGIFSTNFLIPEGFYLGEYLFDKLDSQKGAAGEMKQALGHRCPVCLEVVELGCWSIKANGLLSYFRHFKQRHKDYAHTQNSAFSAPIDVKSRGRKLITKNDRR